MVGKGSLKKMNKYSKYWHKCSDNNFKLKATSKIIISSVCDNLHISNELWFDQKHSNKLSIRYSRRKYDAMHIHMHICIIPIHYSEQQLGNWEYGNYDILSLYLTFLLTVHVIYLGRSPQFITVTAILEDVLWLTSHALARSSCKWRCVCAEPSPPPAHCWSAKPKRFGNSDLSNDHLTLPVWI